MKLAGLLIVPCVIFAWYDFFESDQTKLSNQYEIPESQVFIEPKPHGCDFGDAPLGNKHCHFEKVVVPNKEQNGKVTAVYVSWKRVND